MPESYKWNAVKYEASRQLTVSKQRWIFSLLGGDLRELQNANCERACFFPFSYLSIENFDLPKTHLFWHWSPFLSSSVMHRLWFWFCSCLRAFCCCMLLQQGQHGGWKGYCRLALFPQSLFFHVPGGQWTLSLLHCFPPPFFLWPLPQLWKLTLCYGYEGEDEVCSKFPALLARQPLGSLPTFCKSSLANQNSCWQSPDPEFPDKEMFMLSFFKRSLLPREWGWKKLKPHTGLWELRAGMYGYVHYIVW